MTASSSHDKGVGVDESRASRQSVRAFWRACGFQGLIVIVLLFGDIGFDRPGRFGLDFGHLLLLLAVDLILMAWTVTIAIRTRSWLYAGVQTLLLLAVVASGIGA